MRTITKGLAAALLLFGVTACADLDVTNLNDPDAERALETAGDVESLIGGSFNSWFDANYSYNGAGLFLSNASFQHTAPWANAGMEFYARIPRVTIVNNPADPFYGNFTHAWGQLYRAIAAATDGLRAINEGEGIADDLGAERVARATAFAKFVQGMGHASLALLYDQGFVVDETVELVDQSGAPLPQEPVAYTAMMDAALGYLQEAADLSAGEDFTIPAGWMSVEVEAAELAQIAHSMKARMRAAVARTPAEREAVDWDAVIADVDAGITENWVMDMNWDLGWYNEVIDYGNFPGWAEMPYFVFGMADQSGSYQRWLDMPNSDRVPNPAGQEPILIVTPDERFAQGETVLEQQSNPGTEFVIPCVYDEETGDSPEACQDTDFAIGNVWARPDRGTWRWSYYWSTRPSSYNFGSSTMWIEIDNDEMQLLKAEGLLRGAGAGGAAEAASIINVTRTAAGLNATDAAGTNTDCVPRLPDETCGDLMEMLKWEKRMETRFRGLFGAPWYFDGRGWGDLYRGTYLQFPAPCRELQTLGLLPCYTFGGTGGESASPGSTYTYPDE